jgi:hypothetical protein
MQKYTLGTDVAYLADDKKYVIVAAKLIKSEIVYDLSDDIVSDILHYNVDESRILSVDEYKTLMIDKANNI